MDNLSIDLETLGLKNDAIIVSIGAAYFDISSGEIGRCIYLPVLITKQENRSITGDTVKWWMRQSEEARAVFNHEDSWLLERQLDRLRDLILVDTKVWGNGATFDISILENAYGDIAPWEFYNIRDMRTIVDLAERKGWSKDNVVRSGTHHHALDDAIFQAKCISSAYQCLSVPF